ncbi:nickel-dependent hydrogenase large subunit [Aestuariirhabdus sp. Z084]|uniref:nickel-dependent hydrogenase large subunit n=1 Tax=Aestuariirhabdus haliotis TaxID=2918751 RepID=UPI00201B390F|nr:nickel-dependent hydrogenase large subunit [Aestuariirhabdus haliotis]MCL6415149.1 nickel-dependent hydrogenase large subunit [Aestuariirhabdus haliotis]MCL6420024.1 nickel-dependent hydrogenase large subunit [Aestuariirhabdus haliotis]
MARRVVVDPVTRIEGHLRIDVEVEEGKVSKAWSSGQMWRGIETIVKGRDPRDAWAYTQRICGVCTTVHALASVRAVENALGMEIPKNAQFIRNMLLSAHAIHDHIVHFYHLSALDWVDIVSALKADPVQASKLAEGLSSWKGNNVHELRAVQEKLKGFVASGQLGIFANGYWGHPSMVLPPEVNLIAAAHYLQALEIQREANRIVTVMGGKSPHVQNLCVGGVTNAINLDSQGVFNMERLMYIRSLIDKMDDFIKNAYLVDVSIIGGFYADWTGYGSGVTDYLAVPEMVLDSKGTEFALPGGFIKGGDLSTFKPITSFQDEFFIKGVKESSKHSWYQGDEALHPWDGETEPNYTDFEDEGQYSWIKSPTFYDKPAQVGPLANVLCLAASGHEPTMKHLNFVLDTAGSVAGTKVGVGALHSTIGRHAARAVRCAVLQDEIKQQWQHLVDNIGSGDTDTFNRPEFPKGEQRGVGFHEAPRGVLSHWVVIEDGKIKNYQAVVPSTWNAGPRNQNDVPGPYEASLLDNPVADPEKPLEVLRTVHSFDPCIACAIHLVDTENDTAVKVKAL